MEQNGTSLSRQAGRPTVTQRRPSWKICFIELENGRLAFSRAPQLSASTEWPFGPLT